MDEKETGRIEAFSDGVFAIAITLLILDIHIEPEGGASIFQTIIATSGSHIIGFVISFIEVGVMWINHHRLFTHIKRSNTTLMALNLLLLLSVVIVPVPTSLLAAHIGDTQAALIYNGTFLLMAFSFHILWQYATYHNRLLGSQADVETIKGIHRQYRFGPYLYIIAFVLAYFSIPASLILNLLLAALFAIPSRQFSSLLPSRQKKQSA